MAYIFQLLDETLDVVADLNDSTGANNAFGLKTFCFEVDLGVPDFDRTFFEGDAPGGSLVRARDGLATMTWKQGTVGNTSSDNYRAGVNELLKKLRYGSLFKVQMTPTSEVLYVDYISTDFLALLRGQAIYKIASQLHDPDGMPLACRRQPYLRRAEVSSGSQRLINGSLIVDSNNDGRPNSWTWESTSGLSAESIDAATESYQFSSTLTSAAGLQSNAVAATPGQAWSASADIYGDTSNAQSRIVLSFYDAGDVIISSVNGTLTPGTGDFATVSVSGIAPANTAFVRARIIRINVSGSSSVYRFRRAILGLGASSFLTAVGAVANDPGLTSGPGRTSLIYIHGSAPAAPIVTWTVDGGSLVEIVVAKYAALSRDGGRRLSDYINTRKFLQAEAGTLGANTTSTADADASGGNCAQTTGDASLQKRVTHVISTKLDTLRGATWDVWVRVKPTAAATWGLQLRHGEESADRVENEIPVVNTATSWDYVDVYLGRMAITDSAVASISLELWARRVSGSGNLRWDFLTFVPVDQPSSVIAKLQAAWGSKVLFPGKDLVASTNPASPGAGFVVPDGSMQLQHTSHTNYSVGPAPATGLSYTGTRGRAVFDVSITGNQTITVRIRNITDSTNTVTQAVSGTGRRKITLDFDGVSGKLYQAQVVSDGGSTGRATIFSIETMRITPVAAGEKVRWDSERMVAEHLDAAGTLLRPLAVIGTPGLWSEPGLVALYMHYGDLGIIGFDRPRSILTRAPVVSCTYRPRDLV